MVSTKQPDWDSGCHYIKNTTCALVCMGALKTLWCVHMDVWRPLLILPWVSHSVCLGLHSHANALPTAAESTETGLTHRGEESHTGVTRWKVYWLFSCVSVSRTHMHEEVRTYADTVTLNAHTHTHTSARMHTHTHDTMPSMCTNSETLTSVLSQFGSQSISYWSGRVWTLRTVFDGKCSQFSAQWHCG